MSALPYAEPSSVGSASAIHSNQTSHGYEVRQNRTASHTSLRSITTKLLLMQEASPWAVSKLRRCFDCVVAFLALIILSPVFLLVGLVVWVTSPGPVLFRQKRMGRHGTEFTLYKFRSMRADARPGAWITVCGDPRVTPVGVWLRRFKLDELPQFWNVLRGDMSLVGPRPKLPHHEALLMSVRPGITGAATLAFRHEEKLLLGVPEHALEIFYEVYIKPAKAKIDFEYMHGATFRSDIRLLWTTIVACTGSCNGSLAPKMAARDEEWQVILSNASENFVETWRE
jgi:lipopolysaccharide/colanic/teichoic acid biosynthesis glycosyltransferase